jgi:hypothetical protein
LNGFELRTANDVDGIRPICVTVENSGKVQGRTFDLALNGGPGAGVTWLGCPDVAPVVNGLWVGSEGEETRIINNVHVYCGQAAVNQPVTTYPTAVFDGPSGYLNLVDFQQCPSGQVPVGINGRSGTWLDAVGFICGPVILAPDAVASIGRVKVDPNDKTDVCELARSARARNSVAAPNLEAQCEAKKANAAADAQSRNASVTVGAGNTTAQVGQDNPWLNPPAEPSVCDLAKSARARGSVAAANLEAQCAASKASVSPAPAPVAGAAPAPPAGAAPAPVSKAAVVISQVYSGGGSADGTYANDFIELFNRSNSTVNLKGWSVQYAAGKSKSWKVMKLEGKLKPGHYLLLQQSAGAADAAAGQPMPTPDMTGKLALAVGAGKVGLMKSNKANDDFCPTASKLVDFVGYGTANCAENGVPTPQLANTMAAVRAGGGCIDSDKNAADMQIVAPTPRNKDTAAVQCAP